MTADGSQHGADLSIGSGSEQLLLASTSQPPIYQPLDPTVDCIRLVMVKPTATDAPLECEFSIATFGERPSYQALSYRWGDESVKKEILLNGSVFSVTQNLWDALHYIRSMPQGKFWIDAICINQGDVEERNRQLRIMPHIYLRATAVLVWLGAKYIHFADSVSLTPSHARKGGKVDGAEPLWQLRRDACSDEYWDRLWIIQEIGKARWIRVCLGARPMDWESFIYMMKIDEPHSGALRLQAQLETKYTGGHKLRNLLKAHKNALCKDPRDKIYGLVGLALDGQGFPMDYQKTLFEVWIDTLTFAKKHYVTARGDIGRFAELVRSLLGQTLVPSMGRLLKHIESRPDVRIRKPTEQSGIFCIQAYIIGTIHYMSGTASEMVSRLDTADRWAESLRDNYKRDLGSVHRESDLLLHAILESDDLDRLCFGYISALYWLHEDPEIEFADLKEGSVDNHKAGLRRICSSQSATDPVSSLPSEEPFPFQLTPANPGRKPEGWKLGLVTGNARRGNHLCWAPSIDRMVVVETTQQSNGGGSDYWMRIVGTAVVTSDIAKAPSPTSSSDSTPISLYVDAYQLYLLMTVPSFSRG